MLLTYPLRSEDQAQRHRKEAAFLITSAPLEGFTCPLDIALRLLSGLADKPGRNDAVLSQTDL